MKFSVDREEFTHAVQKADKITGSTTSLSVLSCIMIVAQKDTLKLKATNLDLGIEIVIPAEVVDDGEAAVPGLVLSGFLSNITAAGGRTINISLKGNNLLVTAKNNKTLINTFPKDEFPTISRVDGKIALTVKAESFISGLQSVWYSASVSSIKPELASVYIHYYNNNLVFAATDSFRLGEKQILIKENKEFDSMLIPLKNIREIMRNLEDMNEDVVINVDDGSVAFSLGSTYLVSRIIEGVFPDYRQIIAKEFTTEVVVLKQDMIESLKLSNVFSNKFNQINMKIYPKKKTFHVETSNQDAGESTVAIEAALTGEDLEIGFNFKYIMDCFQSIQSDSISMSFAGMGKSLLIKGVGDGTFLYMVMPMNK